jgi:DnaJ-class molecular chaperone
MPTAAPSQKTVACDRCHGEGTINDRFDPSCCTTCEACWGKGHFACQDGPDGCRGAVEFRSPGYGSRSFPRCEKHGQERADRDYETRRKYFGTQPLDFSEQDANEVWS